MFKQSKLMVRSAIPVRNAAHGIRVAQAIDRIYSGVSAVVSAADHSTILDFTEIRRIVLSDERTDGK
jgi:hypothetical protein